MPNQRTRRIRRQYALAAASLAAEKRSRTMQVAAKVAANMVNMDAIATESHYQSAERFGLVCGDATTSFVGRLPGGMTGSKRTKFDTCARWSQK